MIEFKPLSSTREQILTTTSIFPLFVLTTASVLSLTVSSYACVHFAPTTMTSWLNLKIWQHSLHSVVIHVLEHHLRRVTAISSPDALRGSEQADTTTDRVPLVLTYHPFNMQVKRYLIQNFNILSTDQQTRDIFP